MLDVEGTTDAQIMVTRTTATFSSSNTDGGATLHLNNLVEYENGYGGDSSVGQILFTSALVSVVYFVIAVQLKLSNDLLRLLHRVMK